MWAQRSFNTSEQGTSWEANPSKYSTATHPNPHYKKEILSIDLRVDFYHLHSYSPRLTKYFNIKNLPIHNAKVE